MKSVRSISFQKMFEDVLPDDVSALLFKNTPQDPKPSEGDVVKKFEAIVTMFAKQDINLKDESVHAFAARLGMQPDEIEEMIYALLISILAFGKQREFKGDYDASELDKGRKIELEHVQGSPLPPQILEMIVEKIVKDHLSEIKDYYTRLEKMEKEAKSQEGNSNVQEVQRIHGTDRQEPNGGQTPIS